MKLSQYIFGICVTAAIAVAGVTEWRTYIHVQAEVIGINSGLIPLKVADWGFLKLRAGRAGLDALTDLERHGARDDIRRTSVAVQQQWHEGGYTYTVGSSHLSETFTQDHETRYADLRLPLDGKTLPRNLLPGQHIPDTFWRSQQFRVGCLLRPKSDKSGRIDTCTLRMVDVTGDAAPEIVVEHSVFYPKEYNVPAMRAEWTVYTPKGQAWEYARQYKFCEVPAARYHAPSVAGTAFDQLVVNGRSIDFLAQDCNQDNVSRTPAVDIAAAATLAPRFKGVPVKWPAGGRIPDGLIDAIARRTITLSDLVDVSYQGLSDTRPQYAGLPPCLRDAKGCVAIVADVDHDGRQDVILIGRAVQHDASNYRVATLLLNEVGGWRIAANRALCAEAEDIDAAKFSLHTAKWKPASIGGHVTAPEDETIPADACAFHSIMM